MTKQSQAAKSNVPATQNLPAIVETDTQEHGSNQPNEMQRLHDLAHLAIAELAMSDKHKGSSLALMTYVLAQAWFEPDYTCTVTYMAKGKPNVTESNTFTLADIVEKTDVVIAGKDTNNKLHVARLNKVAIDLFGVTGDIMAKTQKLIGGKRFNASQLQTFLRACNLVYNLIHLLHVKQSDIQLQQFDNTQVLCVPYKLSHKEPEKGFTEKAQYNSLKDTVLPIKSFADLEKSVNSDDRVKKTRGTKETKEEKTPEQTFIFNLGDIILKAKQMTAMIDRGEILKAPIDQRRKMQEALIAIQGLFNAEKKAEEKAAKDEQKELAGKAKAKA